MRKHKIGWCSMTWNPVIGCRNHCEYCYARGIAKRFAVPISNREVAFTGRVIFKGAEDISLEKIRKFEPFFLESQFEKKFPKKSQRIFVGSMSEIYHWEREWMLRMIRKIHQHPRHTFQFLTKSPEVYSKYKFPRNCWLGVTITENDDFDNGTYDFLRADLNRDNVKYISFEPLLGRILSYKLLKYFDWVIIGAETGNRKGKVIPNLEWVADIGNYCIEKSIPIYIKDSIKGFSPLDYKQFPKNLKNNFTK